ncbi:MAG: class I SAM-dependent DNA methyltransferase, partial [Campylobacteraceae bacterium]|nr:class I SAM-dependent DNA methyltransferase [Campylobacteraceae bacterium]
EHQMNLEFYKAFGRTSPSLPLQDGGNIVHGNATRLNWEEVCPKEEGDEIYILGNPPYVGSRMQSKEQKEDMEIVCSPLSKKYKTLDYVAIWFIKGAKYIKNINAKLAFVSTNSITQGEQVALLWKNTLVGNVEIYFAYESFNWTNNAKGNAGVTVVIVGLSSKKELNKYIFHANTKHLVKNINPYLSATETIYLKNRQIPMSKLPKISAGNYTGHALSLSLSDDEKNKLVSEYPKSQVLIKKLLGSKEFLHGEIRWCLWISDEQREFAESILPIKQRIEEVKKARLASEDKSANSIANRPHQYRDTKETLITSVIIPTVSSERREYIPIGFINSDVIVSNRNHIIYDTDIYVFGVVSSKMHNVWIQAVAGRMRMDINYSSDMCYNNFPFPNISQKQKDEITELVFGVLDEREKHSQKTLAQLYDPNKMPEGLKKAHHALDKAIEQCYRPKPFETDEERLEYLFKMYEEMTTNKNIAK